MKNKILYAEDKILILSLQLTLYQMILQLSFILPKKTI